MKLILVGFRQNISFGLHRHWHCQGSPVPVACLCRLIPEDSVLAELGEQRLSLSIVSAHLWLWERCHVTLVLCRIHLPSHYFPLIAQVLMLHWYFFFDPIFIMLKGAVFVFPHVNFLLEYFRKTPYLREM